MGSSKLFGYRDLVFLLGCLIKNLPEGVANLFLLNFLHDMSLLYPGFHFLLSDEII